MSLTNIPLDVQIITSFREMDAIKQDWENFLRHDAVTPGFWQDPQIIQLKIRYKGAGRPLILLLRLNRKIVCIAPCIIEPTRFQLKFSVFSIPGPQVRILKIVDSCLIFSRDAPVEQCIATMLEALYNIRELFDLIKLEDLEENNPLCSFFRTTSGKKYFQLKTTSPKQEHVWRHYFERTYDDWLKTLGKSTRRLIKRRVKALYKNFPNQVELQIITKESEIRDFLNYIEQIYPKTWQAKTFGIQKRNKSEDKIFYQGIAKSGWLRSYMLLIENKPVAFLIATQYAGTFEAQEIGYDPDLSSLGVGSALNYMIMQDLYSHNKPTVLSFGFGDNMYKNILCNNRSPAGESYLILSNFAGFLVYLQIILSKFEQATRSLLVGLDLDKKIRKLLKRK